MTLPEPVRFADVLTTASAVASYLGAATVTAAHLLDAIAILREEKSLEDLGRPVSPLLGGAARATGAVDPAVQALVQRWFARLGADPNATLAEDALTALQTDLHTLTPPSPST